MLRGETAPLAGDGRATIAVETFDTLLIHFAKKIGASVIIRGLRAVSDFEYEFQMVGMNQRLAPDIETVFLMADPRHQAIASRLVKEIASFGGDVSSFTTPTVAAALKKRFAERVQARSQAPALAAARFCARENPPPGGQFLGQHAHHDLEDRPGENRAASRSRAQSCRANHGADEGRLLRRRRLSPRDPGFMAQTGDPDGHRAPADRRSRISKPNSRASPMCAAPARWRAAAIPTAPTASSSSASMTAPWLDGQYTVWGKVVEGMEHIDADQEGRRPRWRGDRSRQDHLDDASLRSAGSDTNRHIA